jgi:hypothetical protein
MRKLDTSCNLVLLSVGKRVVISLHFLDTDELVPRVSSLPTKAFSFLVQVAVEVAHSVSVDRLTIPKNSVVT